MELEDELEESPRASCDWLVVDVEVEPAFGPTKSVEVFWTVDDCSIGLPLLETVVCSMPVGVAWVLVDELEPPAIGIDPVTWKVGVSGDRSAPVDDP